MSAWAVVTCPRCGQSNRAGRGLCWVCDSALGGGRTSSPSGDHAVTSTSMTVLKVVLISLGLVAAIIVMIPVLLLVTCFGLAALGNP